VRALGLVEGPGADESAPPDSREAGALDLRFGASSPAAGIGADFLCLGPGSSDFFELRPGGGADKGGADSTGADAVGGADNLAVESGDDDVGGAGSLAGTTWTLPRRASPGVAPFFLLAELPRFNDEPGSCLPPGESSRSGVSISPVVGPCTRIRVSSSLIRAKLRRFLGSRFRQCDASRKISFGQSIAWRSSLSGVTWPLQTRSIKMYHETSPTDE